MGQSRFQIGVPRVGSAARLAEGAEPMARMPLPRGGSAAHDAEQRNKLAGESRAAQPMIGLRGTGGRVVSMEEMIAASRPAGAAGVPSGAAAAATRSPMDVNRLASPTHEAAHAANNVVGKIDENSVHNATGLAGEVFTLSAHSSVTVARGDPFTSGGVAPQIPFVPPNSVSPGPSSFAVDRVKALVRSLFSRER